MRRGGRLLLLLVILIVVAGALVYFVISQPPVQSVDQTAQPTQDLKRKIVVARIDIPSNTVLTDTETFLTTSDIPESEYNSAPGQYFTSPSELANKQTLRPLGFNERIRRADITDPGLSILIPTALPNQARPKAVPFQVDNLTGVADLIKPNDFVDVLVSFDVQRTVIRPGFGDNGQIVFREETAQFHTTKTLIQNVQILQILKPAVVEGTPTAGEAQGQPQGQAQGQPASTAQTVGTGTFQPGQWLLVLALTDQQAEILKFSVETGNITLVLRGRGDTAVDTTLGSTLSLLVSQFGLPLPNGLPPDVISPADLTPVATTSAPISAPTTTPTPTP